MGGSGGSQKINQIVRESLKQLLPTLQIIHICGQGNVDSTIVKKGYAQFEYVNEELKDIFALTDYVVSRAGANAIFEFLALRIPMLLIPLSLAASRGDQIVNAKSFAESGYAHVLEEELLTEETLVQGILKLQKNTSVLMDQMKAYQSDQARDRVIRMIKEIKKQ